MYAQRDESGATIIELEGHFDADAASALRRSLAALGPSSEVVLDFSRVSAFRDLAIAVLAHGLRAQSIRVRGLATHHERVFRYFGIGPSAQKLCYDDREPVDAVSA